MIFINNFKKDIGIVGLKDYNLVDNFDLINIPVIIAESLDSRGNKNNSNDDFLDDVLLENNLTRDDFLNEEVEEKKLGWINKQIWKFRNYTSNDFLKNSIDYYLVGGMTLIEQSEYLRIVNKDPILLTRYNALIDSSITLALSGVLTSLDYVLPLISNYESNFGTYVGLGASIQSLGISTFRIAYTFFENKPIESFSILSLIANSTTYVKQTDGLKETLNIQYNNSFDLNKVYDYDILRENAKKDLSDLLIL